MTDTTSTRPQMPPWTVTPFRDGYNVHEGTQLVGWFADRALAQQVADEANGRASLPRPTAQSTGEIDEALVELVADDMLRATSPEDAGDMVVREAREETGIGGGHPLTLERDG